MSQNEILSHTNEYTNTVQTCNKYTIQIEIAKELHDPRGWELKGRQSAGETSIGVASNHYEWLIVAYSVRSRTGPKGSHAYHYYVP